MVPTQCIHTYCTFVYFHTYVCIWYHAVLEMVQQDFTSLKAYKSPHYEEHKRRRTKAVPSKFTEQEVKPSLQLPIECT